ncbi:MAG: hypothetical protein AB4058_05400 [Microcystaceae cyanobacterium]
MFWSKSSLSIPTVILSLMLLLLGGTVAGCGALPDNLVKFGDQSQETVILDAPYQPVVTNKLAEVTPPSAIRQLSKSLDQYQPQVRILSPQPNQLLSDTTVQVSLEVQDYPLFQDETLGLGPNLHLIVDNQPYQAVYDVSEPIVLESLSPGSHTLRVFASRPWHESFKNDGAYAQTTFHVLTQTEDNTPDANLPLLTYSRPKGSYGAEPILLDFYLTNAPLHIYSIEEGDLNPTADWRIRVTINGESFLLDRWQPVYLNGFEEGENWVKLEFLDEQGNPVNNAFNNTARLIVYNPDGNDTLSQLVRGELTPEIARSIVTQEAPVTNLPPEVPVSEPEIIEEEEVEEVTTDSELPSEEEAVEVEEVTTDSELPSEVVEVSETEEKTTIIEVFEPAPVSLEEETESALPSTEPEVMEIEEEITLTEEIPVENEVEPVEPIIAPIEETVTPEEALQASETSSPVEILESDIPDIPEELSEQKTTELELKLLESIEKLEQKIDQISESSSSKASPDAQTVDETVNTLSKDVKSRLQKWREILTRSINK